MYLFPSAWTLSVFLNTEINVKKQSGSINAVLIASFIIGCGNQIQMSLIEIENKEDTVYSVNYSN